MKQALIAGAFVIGGILFVLALLLFLQPIGFSSNESASQKASPDEPNSSENDMLPRKKIEYFVYNDSCKKYVMEDFVNATDLFEKNKDELRPQALSIIRAAGKKLVRLLDRLEEERIAENYILVLEGNLNNEWAEEFERNNTWAYRLSYERALTVYKVWLESQIDLRKYSTELIITGGGYYGLCPTKNKKVKRFSVQLIPKNESSGYR